ncbi:DUF6083 domain-containing protein [Streptomyces sp. NPDC048639]|uniref:DUF6083 domain-containing protein n=1 Tax=Streptomyces sp. NPDC048639 TaxID=3365581 RepID=UPI003714EBC1
MGANTNRGRGGLACQRCGCRNGTVGERGRIKLIALLCERCWNITSNELALQEGATDSPGYDAEGNALVAGEPPRCPACRTPIVPCPTNYDRWVHLATKDLPAERVPRRFRWRLVDVQGHGRVAVRIRGVEPFPTAFVRPAHRAVCLGPDAEPDVARESRLDQM